MMSKVEKDSTVELDDGEYCVIDMVESPEGRKVYLLAKIMDYLIPIGWDFQPDSFDNLNRPIKNFDPKVFTVVQVGKGEQLPHIRSGKTHYVMAFTAGNGTIAVIAPTYVRTLDVRVL